MDRKLTVEVEGKKVHYRVVDMGGSPSRLILVVVGELLEDGAYRSILQSEGKQTAGEFTVLESYRENGVTGT